MPFNRPYGAPNANMMRADTRFPRARQDHGRIFDLRTVAIDNRALRHSQRPNARPASHDCVFHFLYRP